VSLSLAPAASQDTVKEYGRAEFDKMITDHPLETPLFGNDLIAAFHKWDTEIGSAKTK
jgi:putative spermidine/putrescine transport system substrate-binding protein